MPFPILSAFFRKGWETESVIPKRSKIVSAIKQREIAKFVQSHPSHKNKNVARLGHPQFHPPRGSEAGGRLKTPRGFLATAAWRQQS
jgi:hypothetical protein